MKNIVIFSVLLVSGILFVSSPDVNAGLSNLNYKAADTTKLCIVTGEEITDGGVKYKYLNKEITVCCDGCLKSFKKEPASYIKDGLHCPVCSEDDAKKDISHKHEGVKYYFCGKGCKGEFENDTQKYLENYNK